MNRGVRGRLVALVVILLVGVSYITFGVLQVRVGSQPFPVTVYLSRGGGLFDGGFVAYRGVDVGRISAIRLVPTGVAVTLRLDPGTRVPARTEAVVHDLSAVGEQYVDLVPRAPRGPYLRRGSVIPQSATSEPLRISTVLNDASALADSVDTVKFGQLLRSLTTALQGTGPQLHAILLAGETMASDLASAQAQSNTVIDQGRIVLGTAAGTNPALNRFSTGMESLTAQLKTSDADIRALISKGVTALPQLNRLLATNTKVLQQLTRVGTTVTGVAADNNAALQALLASLPGTLGSLSSIVRDGVVHSIFKYNDSEPVCTYVTDPAAFPEPTATRSTLTLGRSCTHSAPNLLQRGAAEAPEASP